MTDWVQNIVVLLIVAASLYFIVSQLFRTFAGKKSRVGSCCAQGCPTKPTLRAHLTKPTPDRVVFIPVENLTLRRKP